MATLPPRRREDFTVAVICALPLEFNAAELALDELWDGLEHDLGKAAGDANTYTLGRIGKHNAVLVLLSGMGKVNAASATASLRSSFGGLRLALLCGICGGVPNVNGDGEMLLGDVIISKSVVQYDLGRLFPGQFEPKDTIHDTLGRPVKEIRSLLIAFETHRQKQRLQKEISKGLAEIQIKAVEQSYDVDYRRPLHEDVLFKPDYTHRHRKDVQCSCSETQTCEQATKATCEELGCDFGYRVSRRRLENRQAGHEKTSAEHQPCVFLGSIGSGDTVMKSGKDRDQIARDHSLVAFEMEGAGVWDEIPCIIVKGVCDYSDSHKNKTWQHYAAAIAAAATKALLDRYAPSAGLIEQVKQVETTAFSPKFLVPYVKNPEFVGREEIFNRIAHLFGDTQTGPATAKLRSRVALHGLGGVGKTQIALAYAYWLHEKSPEVSIFWVHASNRQRFRHAFTSIAQVCGIPGYDGKKADTLFLVKQWLESNKSGRWLLIIDNADDKDLFFTDSEEDGIGANVPEPASEGGLGRFIPECLHGSILITTRDMQTGLRMTAGTPPIKVNEMIDAEAVQLLQSLLPNHNFSPSEAIALASRLEYLPLALAQAASFILRNSISINAYFRILDKSDSSLVRQLSEPFASIGRDSETPHALTATWLISFRQIEQRHPLAGNLLSFMSMFDRQAIAKDFAEVYCYEQLRKKSDSVVEVDGPFEGDSGIGSDYTPDLGSASACFDASSDASSETTLEVTNALGILQAFSFISQAGNDTYDMHRLVHLVTRKRVLQEKKMRQLSSEALKMMSRAFPLGNLKNRVACFTYLPHALAVLARLDLQFDDEKVHAAKLLFNVAGYFAYLRQHREAEKHLRRALELQRAVFGQNHPETLQLTSALASNIVYQDRSEEGIELLLPTLEVQRRLLIKIHRQVLDTRRHLAFAYMKQKRHKEAEKLLLETLEIWEGGGNDKRGASRALSQLADVYFKQGRYVEAEQLQLRLLEGNRKLLGEDSEATLWTRERLGRTYQRQGRLSEAVDMILQALVRSRVLMGEAHADTVNLMWDLALVYIQQGRLEAAEELTSEVVDIRRSSMGEKHVDTLQASISLAQVYIRQGRLEKAEELLLKVLDIQKSTKGDEHEDTILSIAQLGRVYSKQGRLEEAAGLLLKAFETWKTTKGEEHEDTIMAIADLGVVYRRQGRLEEAEGLWLKAFEMWKTTKGEEHQDTAWIMGQLGLLYYDKNRLVEAEELQQRALKVRRKVSGEKHTETLTQENNLA
ncbi:kinesin light chain [Colletotrichum scovillei]|uniref:Kinesin light chain n=2 Tax=Colletotrichum scovillei TaxID=1209932 RepID=A0A9P7ULY7_9PEZI|nr:kinesin light chain [Colletotrichum scovillei]